MCWNGWSSSSIHQAKFSMGTVLGLIAIHGKAGLTEFETAALTDPLVAAFRGKVTMVLDREVDSAYPRRWIGKVEVATTDGRRFVARIDAPKGDPENPLTPSEVEDKAVRLACFRDGATPEEMRQLIARLRRVDDEDTVRALFPGRTSEAAPQRSNPVIHKKADKNHGSH